MHIDLIVEGDNGLTQPVEVQLIGQDEYLILYSPGLVEGIAAGDHIKVTNIETGEFKVTKYGGNLSIKIFTNIEIVEYIKDIEKAFSELDAKCDGTIKKACVWTVSLSNNSFRQIEFVMKNIESIVPELTWWYGNVYDKNDKPLNWWKKST
jgi:thiamine biosynthesis protein ThiC